MDTLNELVELISNVGFPIAITVYLLLRLEKKIDRLIDVVERGLARLT